MGALHFLQACLSSVLLTLAAVPFLLPLIYFYVTSIILILMVPLISESVNLGWWSF